MCIRQVCPTGDRLKKPPGICRNRGKALLQKALNSSPLAERLPGNNPGPASWQAGAGHGFAELFRV